MLQNVHVGDSAIRFEDESFEEKRTFPAFNRQPVGHHSYASQETTSQYNFQSLLCPSSYQEMSEQPAVVSSSDAYLSPNDDQDNIIITPLDVRSPSPDAIPSHNQITRRYSNSPLPHEAPSTIRSAQPRQQDLQRQLPSSFVRRVHKIFEEEFSEDKRNNENSISITCCEIAALYCENSTVCCCCPCYMGEAEMTVLMRRARSKGLKWLIQLMFPLIPHYVRIVWILIELIVGLIGLVVSGRTLYREQSIFNIFSFSLSFVSFTLAVIDALYTRQGRSCCGQSRSTIRNEWDVFRIILSELLLYPLLIVNIFKVAEGANQETKFSLTFSLHIISFVFYVVYCYALRAVSLACIVRSLRRVLVESKKTLRELQSKTRVNSAFPYMMYFVIHVSLQMIVQALSTVIIGSKIWFENAHSPSGEGLFDCTVVTLQNGSNITTIHASGYLISTIAIGYITPFLGFLSFFVITYYWSQELPIGLCIDLVYIWKKGSKDDVLEIQSNCEAKQRLIEKVFNYFQMERLESEFNAFCQVPWLRKFSHPFISPHLIACCIFYAAVLVGFCVSALQVHSIENSWEIFYIVTYTIEAIVNLIVLLVALIWVILMALIFIFLTIFVLVCLILLPLVVSVLCFFYRGSNIFLAFIVVTCAAVVYPGIVISLAIFLLYYFLGQ